MKNAKPQAGVQTAAALTLPLSQRERETFLPPLPLGEGWGEGR